MRRTFNVVHSVLRARGLRGREDREDAAQEVYLRAHEKRAARNPDVHELAWIGTIAWNVGMNYVRRRARRQRLAPSSTFVEEAHHDPSGESPEQLTAARRRYLVLASRLPGKRRIVFEMHELDGLPLEDIAAALSLPLGTVKTRLRAAREQLAREAERLDVLGSLVPFGRGAWSHLLPPDVDVEGERERVLRRVLDALHDAPQPSREPKQAPRPKSLRTLAGGGTLACAVLAATILGDSSLRSLAAPLAASREMQVVACATGEPSPENRAAVPAAPETVAPASNPASNPVSIPASNPVPGPRRAHAASAHAIDPEEYRLVRLVKDALARGDDAAVRALVREHAARFPAGQARLANELRLIL